MKGSQNKELIRFDWAIKRLLRNKANYEVLEGFLTVLLREEVKIKNIGPTESNSESYEDKTDRVDIMAVRNNDDLIIIELQVSYEIDYLRRMQYGVAKEITNHVYRGDRYDNVPKVYHIDIVYFEIGQGSDYVYHGKTDFRGIHKHDLLQLTPKQKEHFQQTEVYEVFPEFYLLKVNNFNDVATDGLDQWLYYLKNDSLPDEFNAPGLERVRENLRFADLNEQEKIDYEHHLLQVAIAQNQYDSAYDLGKFEGRAEGRAEEARAIALKMLSRGVDIETIAEDTGLTVTEVAAFTASKSLCIR